MGGGELGGSRLKPEGSVDFVGGGDSCKTK